MFFIIIIIIIIIIPTIIITTTKAISPFFNLSINSSGIGINGNLLGQDSLRPLGHSKSTRVWNWRGARQHRGIAHELGGILADCCARYVRGELGGVRTAVWGCRSEPGGLSLGSVQQKGQNIKLTWRLDLERVYQEGCSWWSVRCQGALGRPSPHLLQTRPGKYQVKADQI